MHSIAIIVGALMPVIGFNNSHRRAAMMVLKTALTIFEEAGNGSVFALSFVSSNLPL